MLSDCVNISRSPSCFYPAIIYSRFFVLSFCLKKNIRQFVSSVKKTVRTHPSDQSPHHHQHHQSVSVAIHCEPCPRWNALLLWTSRGGRSTCSPAPVDFRTLFLYTALWLWLLRRNVCACPQNGISNTGYNVASNSTPPGGKIGEKNRYIYEKQWLFMRTVAPNCLK